MIRLSGTNVHDVLKGVVRCCNTQSSLPSLLTSRDTAGCHQPGKGSRGSSGFFSQFFVSLTPAGDSHTDGRQKYWLLMNFPPLQEHKCVKKPPQVARCPPLGRSGVHGSCGLPLQGPLSASLQEGPPPPSTQQLLAISRSWHKTPSARSLAKAAWK